ncbi:hypothetical protein OE88DRAFT_1737849 [Heliocybe sulcata]|uniref:DUF6534 domain-containing protein n=1 Tax=Heliocybe sulcata TaxID=5364 RepID=A0A5C3MTQ5_9AGAM|nr:hypothetical protein OE88DRAFT_1737849 [Heliocybe sulcata]
MPYICHHHQILVPGGVRLQCGHIQNPGDHTSLPSAPLAVLPPSMDSIIVTSYGSLLVGLVVSAVLFGITNLQVFIYFKTYRNDVLLYKLSVGLLWFLDAFHLALSTHAVFWYLVTNFGRITLDIPIVWSFKLELVFMLEQRVLTDPVTSLQIITVLIVQRYVSTISSMGHPELRQLSNAKPIRSSPVERSGATRLAVCFVLLLVLGNYGMNIATVYFVYAKMCVAEQAAQYAWLIYASYASCTAVDLAIVVTFCWTMWGHRTGHARSNSMIHRIIVYVLGSGSLTSLFCIICLVTLASMPGDFVSYGISFSLNKIYVNSFLAMLNSRGSFKQGLEDEEVAARNVHQHRMVDLLRSVGAGRFVPDKSLDAAETSSGPDGKAERATTTKTFKQSLGQTKSIEIMIDREAFTRVG